MKKTVLWFALLAIAGCASRQKEVQKSYTEVNFKAMLDSLVQYSFKLELQKNMAMYARNVNSSMNVSYDGQKGDSLSIDQYGPDGNITSRMVITGSGKAEVSNNESSSERAHNETVTETTEEDSKAKVLKDINAEATSNELTKKVASSGFSFWSLLWLLLLLIPVFWYYRKKIIEKLTR